MNDQARSDHETTPARSGVPKTHPAAREWLPEDPSEMFAVQIPGDPDVMLALIAEEYLQMGHTVNDLMALAADSNYRALHGLYARWGSVQLREKLEAIASRVGVFRASTTEVVHESCSGGVDVVPLTLPDPDRVSNERKENM